MWPKILFLAWSTIPIVRAINPCPLDGPVFPKPTGLALMPTIQAAALNLTRQFEAWNSNYTAAANFSYSVQIFSAHEESPLFSVSHTAPTLNGSEHPGVTNVDENTVFRLGSLTKIFTIYNFLLNAGDEIWNAPITRYVPELASLASRARENPVIYTSWDDVTIGSLATQMSGIPRDYALLGELTQMPSTKNFTSQLGFPPIAEAQLPPCGDIPLCSREQFFTGMANFHPSVAPFQTPTYSDVGFQLLGYALAEITGKDYQSVLQDTVLTPLNLKHTYYTRPNETVGIIPGNIYDTNWYFQLGEEAPAGNMYSSAADIAAFGRAILSYKQLSPVMTRRWLKPFSFSSDFRASVGAPWGVRRIPLGPEDRQTTGYNKAGAIGSYQAAFVLIPDYDVGFSIMVAGSVPGNTNWNIADMLGETFVPALTAAARDQAAAEYNGHYEATSASVNGTAPPLNSSLVVETDDLPGLSISQWFSNGTDFRTILVALQGGQFPRTPSIRLYPAGLETTTSDGGKKIKFKAIFEDLSAPERTNKMFSTDCGSWVGVESVVYASMSTDDIIFVEDRSGKVTNVELPALRITLSKVS